MMSFNFGPETSNRISSSTQYDSCPIYLPERDVSQNSGKTDTKSGLC